MHRRLPEQFDRIMRGAPPLVLFRVMAGNARAWEKFRAGSLLDRGPLSLREREIVIDRTCARTGCEYEWGVHVAAFAEAAHLTEEQVRATVLGAATEPCWSEAEQALIAAVDALHDRATLSDAEFARCRRITTRRRFSRSSCSADSIARCRISRTGWRCRWRRRRQGFRKLAVIAGRSEACQLCCAIAHGMLEVHGASSPLPTPRNDVRRPTPRPRAAHRADARCRPACRRR